MGIKMFRSVSLLSCRVLLGGALIAFPVSSAVAQVQLPPPGTVAQPSYEDFGSVLGGVSVTGGDQQPQSPGMALPTDGLPDLPPLEEEQTITDEAFEASLTGAMPLTPEQIREFLGEYDKTQEAIAKPIYDAPTPKVFIETVSLDPGVVPLEIKTSVGFVTTLNFIDVTGEKWAIQDIGWAGDYEVLQPEDSSNVLRITPLSEFGHGNVSIRLVDLKTPIILSLKTARDEVHYRADLRIPELGPDAAPPLVSVPISTVAGKTDMTAILTGVVPQESESLVVSGVDSRTSAYTLDGHTYVRTPLTLLSPGWSASVKSADGTTVYQVGDAPVLLLSDGGRIVRAYLKTKEAVDGF